jgi:mannan endo-1,6-alpha-mannosidase
MKGRSNVLTIP